MIIGNRVAILRQKFAQSIGLPFAEILTESEIEQALQKMKALPTENDSSAQLSLSGHGFLKCWTQTNPVRKLSVASSHTWWLLARIPLRRIPEVIAKHALDSKSECSWD